MGLADQFSQQAGAAVDPNAPVAAAPVAAPVSAPMASQFAASAAAATPSASSATDQANFDAANYVNGGDPTDMLPFFQAAFHNVVKPLHGATQIVEHTIASALHAAAPNSAADNYAWGVTSGDDKALQAWEQQYQKDVPDSPQADAGAVTGTLAPFVAGAVPNMLEGAGTFAASKVAPLLKGAPAAVQKVGQYLASLGTQGAIVGAVQPVSKPVPSSQDPTLSGAVTGENDAPGYWSQVARQALVGGATAPLIPAAVSAAGGVAGLAKPFTQSGTAKLVGDFLSKMGVNSSVADSATLVPGSQPTTAQLAGSPDLVAAEKALANNPSYKGQFAQRDIDNNAARWNAVNTLAGTPEDLQAAVDARKAATGPLYDAATSTNIPLTADLQGILGKVPGSVLSNAADLAALDGRTSTLIPQVAKFRNFTSNPGPVPGADAVPSGAGPAQAATADVPMPNVTRTVQVSGPGATGYGAGPSRVAPPMVSGQDLHYLKLAMDDATEYNPQLTQGGLTSTEQAGVKTLQGQLVNHMDTNMPGYADARQTYGDMSVPINDMQVGQAIQQATENKALNAEGTPILTLSGFNSALNKGMKGQEFGVSPAAQSTLDGIQDDLQRSTISSSVSSRGSDTSYNIQAPGWLGKQLFGENYEGAGSIPKLALTAAALMKGGPAVAGATYLGLGKVGAAAGKNVNDALVDALLNPSRAASLMTNQPPTRAARLGQMLLDSLPNSAAVGTSNGTLPVPMQQSQ